MGKYGTNLEGFGGFEGGVNADKGAPLVSTSSDGETALLFGPAALREIQAGVANGDFAIPPDAAGDTITAENPLPYWTWTPATGITAAIVADSGAGSGNICRVSCAAATYSADTYGKLTRYIPVASSNDRGKVYVPVVRLSAVSGQQMTFAVVSTYYKLDGTTTGISFTYEGATNVAQTVLAETDLKVIPADAATLKIEIWLGFATAGSKSAGTADIAEVRLISGDSYLYLTPDNPAQTIFKAKMVNGKLTSSQGLDFGASELTNLTTAGITISGQIELTGSVLSQYDKGGSADNTTITTAGTYYALTNAEASFTPQFVGQRWLLCFTANAALNTTVVQYLFVRSNITDSSNTVLETLGFSRADMLGTSNRGGTVAFTKVWVSDTTSARKFKLYGTVETTNGLTLALRYTQMTAYPIG